MDVEDLSIVGLSASAQLVYLTALDRRQIGAEDACRDLEMASDDVRDTLEILRERGLVSTAASDANLYVAADPRDALKADAERAAEAVSRLQKAIPVLGSRFDQAGRIDEDGSGAAETSLILTNQRDVAAWYVRLQQRADRLLRVFDRPPYVSTPLEAVEQAQMARGVDVRALYVSASFDRPGAWQEVERLSHAGEQGRIAPALPFKLAISDSAIALVSLAFEEQSVEALVTWSPSLVAVFTDVFESSWSKSSPLFPVPESSSSPRGGGVPGSRLRDRAIISLIAGGATDETIALRLGISERSVRRRTSELMHALGASTRFQFGVLAERAGWT